MQDGDSDLVQQNISTYSPSCPFCTSSNQKISSTITITSPGNTPTTTAATSTSKPLCPYCNRCIIQVLGTGPGKRAGHTATAVGNRYHFLSYDSIIIKLLSCYIIIIIDRIFLIGGGFGNEYVQNIHILDTDACLKPEIVSPSCHHNLQVENIIISLFFLSFFLFLY